MQRTGICVAAAIVLALAPLAASAHILAMVNYESKTEEGLRAHGIKDHGGRKEGLAVIDVDPGSETFGKIMVDIPLPPDLIGHHLFYNRDMSKLYMTALGQGWIYVMDMKVLDYKLKKVLVPGCVVGEDIIFSGDNKTGSSQGSVHVERGWDLKGMSFIRYLEVVKLSTYLRGNSCSLRVWSRQRSSCKGFVW